MRDYSQLTAFAQACEEKLGGIDVIVNNAGVASGGFFNELSLEDWDWQIAINLMGVVKGCKAFLPLLEKSKGKIINIASMAALMQGPAMSNYNVAKAGVVALSESLLVELAQQEIGVHVTTHRNRSLCWTGSEHETCALLIVEEYKEARLLVASQAPRGRLA